MQAILVISLLQLVACDGGKDLSAPRTLSSDAFLTGLSLSPGSMTPEFQPDVYDYTASVGYLGTTVTVTPIADQRSKIEVNGVEMLFDESGPSIPLDNGINTVTVTVTAEDGVTSSSYSIDVNREYLNSLAERWTHGIQGPILALSGDTLVVKSSWVIVHARDPSESWSVSAGIAGAIVTDSGDGFGRSVAISGDTLVVGATGEDSSATGINGNQLDNNAPQSGAVYIFRRDAAGIWSQNAFIKASNTQPSDAFGMSLAIDGDTLVVGARNQVDNNDVTRVGALYVFVRDMTGIWSQQAIIKAPNPAGNLLFGCSVAVDGDTLVVTAEAQSCVSGSSGAAYVFIRDPAGIWSQQAYIESSEGEYLRSVALSRDTLVAGPNVFIRDRVGAWGLQAHLERGPGLGGLGFSAAISGDTVAMGYPPDSSSATGINGDETDTSNSWTGAVYVFTRDVAGIWSRQAYVKPSKAFPPFTGPGPSSGCGSYGFGFLVALDGDTLAVGAQVENCYSPKTYVFK